jgi:glycosyltransferase involved in cell wall biosynthesis
VGKSIYANRVESLIRPHLEWADTVLVEGARAGAALVSLVDPGSTRVVVRMHYADLLNYWPQLIDFTRVGDVIFDAPHVRDFAVRVVPRLAGAQHPPLHVIAGAISAGMPALPKPDDARFTLAVIGVGAMATDPRWSVAVLRHLHERDQRYRLLLVGDGLNTGPAKINAYEDLLSRDIAELNGAVHRRSQHSDLSRLIAEVGVILNGSVRDGFPYAVIDGAASGAIPVVRDWPFGSAQDNGARTLLPADWVVDSAEQAAERILKLTSSNDVWREAGEITSRQVRDLWDRTAELEAFDAVLLGQGSAD